MSTAEPPRRGSLRRLHNGRSVNRNCWPLHTAWNDRVWQEFEVSNLTPCDRDVLLSLPTFRGPDGAIFPSQAVIAERAGCNERTVRRALSMGAKLGMVITLPRRKKANGRWVRTSNRYLLNVPEARINAGLRPPWPRSSTGQFVRVQDSVSKKEAHERMVREAAGAPDLLAARRRGFLAEQLAARR
jgi:hypothetical protein